MAMECTEIGTVRNWIRDKQQLEIQVADALLVIFNEPGNGLIGPLRELVGLALAEMNTLRHGGSATRFRDKVTVKGWANYAGASGFDFVQANWDPGYIAARTTHLSAQHCADWIRIYGEVVEEGLAAGEDARRKAYQRNADEGFWEKEAGGLRQRVKAATNPQHAAYDAAQTEAWRVVRARPSAGIQRWDIDVDKDTTGRMDQVFGLMPGACISGTTTDNIYFLDKFSRMHLDPVYYLLPLAAIVGGGHHSLLEVALPLTLNHLVDYKVGLYSTLLPKRLGDEGLPSGPKVIQGVQAIRGVLKTFEDKVENRLMLVYYQGVGQPKGCFLYDATTDLKSWDVIARADERLLRKFKEIKTAWPNRNQVLSLSWMGNEKTDMFGGTDMLEAVKPSR